MLALFLVVAGFVALAVDLPVSKICRAERNGDKSSICLPGDLKKGVAICEAFGHGVGVGLILLTVYVLDSDNRRRLPRMIACVLAGGIAANVGKMLVARTRPNALFREDLDLSQFTVWDTFEGLLRFGAGDSPSQSFPSAHSATAAALAVALIWRYPRGRWLFAAFAVLAGSQRIVFGAHYLSDVCWGLAIGLAVAAPLTQSPLGDRLFGKFEQRIDR